MSDLFGNHIVGFPTRRLKLWKQNIFLISKNENNTIIAEITMSNMMSFVLIIEK